MKETDLETDTKLGIEYSVNKCLDALAAVEEHFETILSDKKYALWCVGCLRKHDRLIRDKAIDCQHRFACPPHKQVWEWLEEWTWKLQDGINKLHEMMKERIKKAKTEKVPIKTTEEEEKLMNFLREIARAFRKTIEGDPGWTVTKLGDILGKNGRKEHVGLDEKLITQRKHVS